MKIENLKYEYNSDLIGYVVEDTETNKTINFQFEKIFSNHPTPDFILKSACEGDDTFRNFSDEERISIRNWLRSHEDVLRKEDDFTDHAYNHENDNIYSGSCSNDNCIF